MTESDSQPLWIRVGDTWADFSVDGAAVIVDRYGSDLNEHRRVSAQAAIDRCESPIEQRLLTALWQTWPECEATGLRWQDGTEINVCGKSGETYLIQQVRWGKFRLDFALWDASESEEISMAIECDGHDFHERTREQAKRDRSRDRELTAAGITVLRFTGSEIHADAEGCAREVRLAHLAMHFRTEIVRAGITKEEGLARLERHMDGARGAGATR